MTISLQEFVQGIVEASKLTGKVKDGLLQELTSHILEEERELQLQGYNSQKIIEIIQNRWGDVNRVSQELFIIHTMPKIFKDILQATGAVIIGFFLVVLLMVLGAYLINGGQIPHVGDSLDKVLEIADKRQHELISIRRIDVTVYKAGDEEKLLHYLRANEIVLEDDSYNVLVKDTKDSGNYGYILHKENDHLERRSITPIENQIIIFTVPTGMRSYYIIDKNNMVVQKLSEG